MPRRSVEVVLVDTDCCVCGTPFAMSETLYQHAKRHSEASELHTATFYCPAGHPQHFTGEPSEQALRRQIASLEEDVRAAKADAQAAKMREGKQRRRADSAVKRGELGLCQYCHRRVRALADHVATKHPEHVHVPPERVLP